MLRELFIEALHTYSRAQTEPFAKHPFQALISKRIPEELKRIIGWDERYTVKGSAGKGQWTFCPWVATMDNLVTNSPERGYYPTFLFRKDLQGFYLTLNQGITDLLHQYKSGSKEVLRVRAADLLARIGSVPAGFKTGQISLAAPPSSAPALYEYGNVICKYYPRDSVPPDEDLVQDYRTVLEHYLLLVEGDTSEAENFSLKAVSSEDYFEDAQKWRYHKRIERNQNLVRKAKKLRGKVWKIGRRIYRGAPFDAHFTIRR